LKLPIAIAALLLFGASGPEHNRAHAAPAKKRPVSRLTDAWLRAALADEPALTAKPTASPIAGPPPILARVAPASAGSAIRPVDQYDDPLPVRFRKARDARLASYAADGQQGIVTRYDREVVTAENQVEAYIKAGDPRAESAWRYYMRLKITRLNTVLDQHVEKIAQGCRLC